MRRMAWYCGMLVLALGILTKVHAEDCYNDDDAPRNDLAPPALTVTDAELASVLAAINANERRSQATRAARIETVASEPKS